MRTLTLALTLSTLAATAAVAAPATFLVDGKPVPTEQAVLAAIRGKSVFKCTEVEAKASATGTSIGLKSKK